MNKCIFSMICLVMIFFLLAGCKPMGQATAGQFDTGRLSEQAWMDYQQKITEANAAGIVSPEVQPTYVAPSMPEPISTETGTHLDCMAAEVTVKTGTQAWGTGSSEDEAKTKCLQNLVQDAWGAAALNCMKYLKEGTGELPLHCSVASGTLNPDKDINVVSCTNNGDKWTCRCSLNKDKEYVCNSH